MKTLICQQPGVMEYVEKDIPTPADNEVLLKIKAVGICGTDIHAFAGRQPFFSYPRVLGHEICAEAVSRGSQCQIAQSGQRYSVIPCIPCGKCAACREEKTNCCERVSLYGVHQDGGFSEYLAVREDNLVPLPDEVSDSAGALVECFAIGAHAVRRAEIKAEQNVLVLGQSVWLPQPSPGLKGRMLLLLILTVNVASTLWIIWQLMSSTQHRKVLLPRLVKYLEANWLA